ncbi:DUF6745 domain-containing protein [Gordonia sp. SID5947]|uniref:DUF6745 domain-containing protein n=1 Tax=Gordonia sp. SID5947 TaxID=2690315 RepID=UPI001925220E
MSSPPAAVELIEAQGLFSPLASLDGASGRIAHMISRSRRRLNPTVQHWMRSNRRHPDIGAARSMTADEAIALGVDVTTFLGTAVRDSLRTSLFDGVASIIRTVTPSVTGLVTWYGQQEAHRVGFHDALRKWSTIRFSTDDLELLAIESALVAATGWWWPFDAVCIMAERPTSLHSEPTPGGVHNERRLHHPDAPAIEFADGRSVYVLHGTIVPDWVIRDPTAERISRERSIEVRRSAIERIGWDVYIDAAGLSLVDQTDDPGNPGCSLQLYASPHEWQTNGKILLAVNGSRERDGHRRRYGLQVPGWVPNALEAAAWSYGIRGADYARLVRRT